MVSFGQNRGYAAVAVMQNASLRQSGRSFPPRLEPPPTFQEFSPDLFHANLNPSTLLRLQASVDHSGIPRNVA